jgi:preprotein translocase subunit SecB
MEALFTAMTSPLQLDRYFLKSLRFHLNRGFDRAIRSYDPAPPDIEIGVVSADQSAENPAQWRFEVSIELLPDASDGNFPYTIETTLVGFFTVDERYPPENRERLAKANGPALLYSCAREIIASVTGRSPYPRLLIPSVTFIQPEVKQPELPEHPPKQLGPAEGLRSVTD